MSLYGLAKFITGFLVAIALLFLAGAAAARYIIEQLSDLPPRPVFANDSPIPQAAAPAANPTAPAANPTAPAATPAATPAPAASPSPSPTGAEARVSQPIGLIVREGPSRSSSELGGVAYNQQVTILETSPDGEWQRVRIAESGLEGWVKAGNTEPIN